MSCAAVIIGNARHVGSQKHSALTPPLEELKQSCVQVSIHSVIMSTAAYSPQPCASWSRTHEAAGERTVARRGMPCMQLFLLLGLLANTVMARCIIEPDTRGGVVIPAGWAAIDDGAFRACMSLRSVSFERGSQLTTIGLSAFSRSGLTSMVLPASLVIIEDLAFNNCGKLRSVSLESGSQLTTIGRSAFSHLGLPDSALPTRITNILQAAPVFPHNAEALNETRSAVCLVGFDGGKMALASIKALVLKRLGADLFVAPTGNSVDKLVRFFDRKAPKWRDSRKGNFPEVGESNYLDGLPGFGTHSRCAYQLKERYTCLKLIRHAEKASGFEYDRVGIGRRDLLWLKEHPEVSVRENECWIPCEANDWSGYCDHWALCGRRAFRSYTATPFRLLPLTEKVWRAGPGIRYHNIEGLLRLALEKDHVQVKRGVADFVRSCPNERNARSHCEDLPLIGARGKMSGGQVERANQLLGKEPGLAQYLLDLDLDLNLDLNLDLDLDLDLSSVGNR